MLRSCWFRSVQLSRRGVSLRYDPVYDQLRKLRKADDELPQGVWKSEPKRADWNALEELCLDVIETRSKDIQVAAWLLEAWIHLYGFAGAGRGHECHPRAMRELLGWLTSED